MKVAVSLLALVVLVVLSGCACNPSNDPMPTATYSVAPPPCAQPMAPDPCPSMMMATPEQEALCGSLPTEAKPGEVWCCVAYSIPQAPQRVCSQQPCEQRISIPAVYETRTEQVMVAPSRIEWQKVPCATSGSEDCWKLVEIPAIYESKCTQCEVQPASYRIERSPAVYEEIFSAPLAGHRWERVKDCEVPMAPTMGMLPPAGMIE